MSNNIHRLLLAVIMLGLMGVSLAAESEAGAKEAEPSTFEKDVKQVVQEIKAALDSIDVYRTPQVPQPADEELSLSCQEIEWAMAAVVPETYSYTPSFYDDPVQGAGIWVGTMYSVAYATVLYGVYHNYQEERRIISAEDRVTVLRRLKAEKRCYES